MQSQTPAQGPRLGFQNTYARLPERFFVRQDPAPVATPTLLWFNPALASQIGIAADALEPATLADIFGGNLVPADAEPLAMAYAGHQFGGFSPQLGDGRALLLGEVTGSDGVLRDVQLKGSGRTPFSRMGDGLAPLGAVLREVIVSEAMAALGIPTTRALAAVATGGRVVREEVEAGAVLTRVARGHVRVGTFQYFAARRDVEALRALADYTLSRNQGITDAGADAGALLFEKVISGQADLIARWMAVGFIHGVMNTDNMSLACETIDYGPCAFMDGYDPARVLSSIDHGGRYAYANQPAIGGWNLARLAEALLPILHPEEEAALKIAQDLLDTYPSQFAAAYQAEFSKKLGLATARDGDDTLIKDLLTVMADAGADFTLTFRALCNVPAASAQPADDGEIRALFQDAAPLDAWLSRWRERVGTERADAPRMAEMAGVNPAVIPRNHKVNQAIAAAQSGDFAPFHGLNDVLATPFQAPPPGMGYDLPPRPDERVYQTFCGT
ncbi:MAG: YdiU family protein [Pseudomonadota bacterium]